MMQPGTAREALIVEALGEAATLIRHIEALAPILEESRQAFTDAHRELADQLMTFEVQVTTLTEKVKVQAVKHIVARTDEAALRVTDQLSRSMTVAARAAFDAELDAAPQRLQAARNSVIDRPGRCWETWLTHLAAAATASAATWTMALTLWPR
jgi:hypothetical protein